MKKKRIAMLLVATLTFSQSMGAVIPVAAEELTADTGQETAETEESEEIVQENDASETTGEAASVPDLEDDEELSLQDDAENAEEEIAEEENTSETTELFGDNTENQEAFSDGSEAGESAEANEQYQLNLIFEGASGSQDLLPNSHVRIKSRLVDTIGCSDVSAYELKVAPVTGGNGVKMADVSLDGQDIVLDVYNKTGDARISATASINGTEVAKREFWVNISEYVILPEKITDTSGNEINLEVGQQLDIAKDMKPQLVRYKDGKGDPIPLTGDNYKIVMSQTGPGGEEFRDYDADGLKWIEVPGQDLPILERTTENSTWFALLAMERSENGDWHYITRHHYELTSLISNDYDNGHNDDSEEKSSYRLVYDYQDTTGNGAMLPNSQMTATTYLEDKTKDYQRVDDYKLEILEQSKLADISVSADGKKLVIKSGNKTGQGCCYISVQIPDGKGGYREAFRKDMWFSVSEYVILPEKITDANGNVIIPKVGQQVDIVNNMKPQLVRYKDGKGDPIPVTGDNYKIVISSWTDESTGTVYHDYDTDGWKWIDVPGQELPILERTSGYGTYFGLTAMEKSADGNWHQIARRMYELDTLPGYNGDDSGNFGDSDDSEEKSFYNLTYDLEGTAGNEAMLPNNETTIVTDILDKTSGQHPVKDYKLEIIEQSKLAEATVSPDGKKLIIKSNDKTGVGCCYVAVKLLDKTGEYKEAFRKDIWFEVSEFMLLPENLTDKNGKLLNPAVGESINLANLKVKLVQYINGKGDPVEITGNDIKIVVMSWKDTESGKLQYDYDDEAWNMQKVSGQELPIMTRKSDDNTRLALSAMRKNKNGEWERLVRKHFEIGENSSKHSHSWKAVKTVQATCTSKGSRTDKCTSCDGVRTVTLPAKHTAVKDAAVAATVFKAGKKEGSHCKVCGKVLRKQITVAKLKPTISLTTSSLKMKAGQSTTAFKAAGLAKGDYVTKVTSGNTGIVKVSSVTKKGTFRLTAGKKAGSTTVKVILASKKSASFKVTVQRGVVKTSKITVSTKSVTLKKGTTYRKLASSVKVTPVTSQEKVTYTSSNKKIVTVTSGGVIKGLKKGTATITIRSGSKRTTCKVTVK